MPVPREVPLADSRLTGSDKRALALWILCGIIGAVFAQKYFLQAFPEASVDFKISRGEAQNRAKNFLQALGENPAGYQSTIDFGVDETGKTYLERELGLKQANQLMTSDLDLWYWEVRYFKPQQEEEYRVQISPAGKVVGYEHKIPEAQAGETLTREEAQAEATQFLEKNLGVDLSGWNFLAEEANSVTRPKRLDWSFTWERKDFKAKDAPYRLSVQLQGDKISGTQEFLRVPEAWKRSYAHLRSTNNFYGTIALIPFGFLLGGALWLALSLTRRGQTTWSAGWKVSAVVVTIYLLMELNQWDSHRATYDTHDAYGTFVLLTLLGLLLLAIFQFALPILLSLTSGEPLYRAAQPDKLRVTKAFSLRGLRSKEFFCAAVVGLSMAAAHIGFVVAFYMIGSRFGVWAPQDVNYSDIVNTSFPWIAGVAIGVVAATSEEFLFRLFAVPFLHRMTGSRALAVILPAFFWGFLHSAYPQEPGYIRGVEVGLIGIVAGLVMLRWGIAATLIWHYTVDATLVGMFLIRSDNLYFKISGIVVGLAALAPLTFSGVTYLLRDRFEPVEDLLNSALPKPELDLQRQTRAEEAVVARKRYTALSAGTVGVLALALVIGGLLAWRVKKESIGDYLRISVNSREALDRANGVLREHNVDPRGFRNAATMADTTNPIANEFLRRRMPIADINKIYAQQVPGALWRVRYFRDLQPEEYAVILRPDGSVHSFRHILAEEAKGANLSKGDALAIAEKYLREQKKIDLSGWKLVYANSDKRPNRTDHSLTWQQNTPLDTDTKIATAGPDDHAYARMDLDVLGDEPANYRTYIKIPEEFERQQQDRTLPRALVLVGQVLVGVALVIAVLVFYFKRLRAQPPVRVPWKRLLYTGLAGLAFFILNLLLGRGIPALLSQYPTSMPLRLFLATSSVGVFIIGALTFAGVVLLFGLAWNFAARAYGEEALPSWFGMPGVYYRDAFLIGLCGTAALIGLNRLLALLAEHWFTLHRGTPASFGDSFDAILPAAAVLGSLLLRALFYTGIFALAAAFLGAELRVRWLRLLIFLAVAAALVSGWGNGTDFLKQFLVSCALLGFAVFGIRWVARFNLLGWFLVVACVGLAGGASELLTQPNNFYRTEGYIVVAAIVALLGWPLLVWRLSGNKAAEA